jgi:hypothetical protein
VVPRWTLAMEWASEWRLLLQLLSQSQSQSQSVSQSVWALVSASFLLQAPGLQPSSAHLF